MHDFNKKIIFLLWRKTKCFIRIIYVQNRKFCQTNWQPLIKGIIIPLEYRYHHDEDKEVNGVVLSKCDMIAML